MLVLVMLLAAGAAVFGVPVAGVLSAGGGVDPGAQSSAGQAVLAETFGRGGMSLVITVRSEDGVDAPRTRAAGIELVRRLTAAGDVGQLTSPWTAPPATASALTSADGRTGLITAVVAGDETEAPRRAHELVERLVHDRDGVEMRAGGEALVNWQVNAQTQHDLLLMEAVALPLSFVVLIWVFGGLLAAALPVTVGIVAILGAMAVLRAVALVTEVSIFALNLTVALGLALAIDYTLLIVSRFRDELRHHADRHAALRTTMITAGRTVLFSAATVALSMATLVLFPQYFLKSFAYAGVAVIAVAAATAVVVTPAAIVLLGDRLDAGNVGRWLRRLVRRPDPRPTPDEEWFWYRWTRFVMRHSVLIGVAVTGVLLVLGLPFLDARWGFADDRVLPASASARQVGDELRAGFPATQIPDITVVLPDTAGVRDADLSGYAAALSRVPGVTSVSAPTGGFACGRPTGPPTAPSAARDGRAFLTVTSSAPLYTTESAVQLDRLQAVAPPAGRPGYLTGAAQGNQDSVAAIAARLPWVLTLIVAITGVVVFLLTRSAVLPVKAVLLNALSLTAAFGALVWVFQQGHLGGLGTATTGTLGVQLPVLLFCIAFGLCMDYEVFLIARIREYWLSSHQGWGANDRSVALGVAHTARVITAAALIMAISFSALMAAQVSLMRLLGFGLTLAVAVDATLVRLLLVPAFMHLFGRRNWWAPAALVRVADRIAPGR